jgi:UDP-3-O-[3-hydroxymyristoyl] glucosamine N-acyltransferase
MDNQSISLDVSIGNNVVMWSSNHIGDKTRIDDHGWISSHATVAADVKIGERAFLGIGATVSGRVTIGRESFLGANVLVSSDVPERAVRIAGHGDVDAMSSSTFMRVLIASGKL